MPVPPKPFLENGSSGDATYITPVEEAAPGELAPPPPALEVGASKFSMQRNAPVNVSTAFAMYTCMRHDRVPDGASVSIASDYPATKETGAVPGPSENGKSETPVCWCCRLGDSYFDRLVKHAVVEHERLLHHLSLQEGGPPRQDRYPSVPKTSQAERSFTLSQNTLLYGGSGRPRRMRQGTLGLQSGSFATSGALEVVSSRPSGLAKRCARQPTAILNEAYFEQCSKVASEIKSVTLKGTTARQHISSFFARVVRHPGFDIFFAALILLDSILIGYGINERALSLDWEQSTSLNVAQFVLNAMFVLEWVFRLTGTGCRKFFSARAADFSWNVFDTLLICFIVFMDWGAALVYSHFNIVSPSSLRAARALRLTRVMRVVRVSRLLTMIRSFRFLVCSIAGALQSLVWAMLLLMLLFYMFASLLTQAVTDYRVQKQDDAAAEMLHDAEYYWGSVRSSILTLFMSICGGVSWIEPMGPLLEVGAMWTVVFLAYISFAYFAVLNVVTGVFCEKAIKSANDDHYHMLQLMNERREEFEVRLQNVFKKIDLDSSGHVTLEEFEQIMRDEEIKMFFEMMDIKVDDARDLFRYLDVDGGGLIDVTELVAGTMRIRGTAKGLDMILVHHDVKKVKDQVRAIAAALDELFYMGKSEHQRTESTSRPQGAASSRSVHSSAETNSAAVISSVAGSSHTPVSACS